MKRAFALLLLSGPVLAAPAAPAPNPAASEKTIPDRKADKESALPASAAPEDVTTPPSPELKAAARKAAETVVSSPKLEETRPIPKADEAIETLVRLAAALGGQDGVDSLLLAAKIARRDLKDYVREAALLHRVSDDYALAEEAPRALYDAARVYEDDVKDSVRAIAVYREVASRYPSTRLAKKASRRAAKWAAAK
ncbi:MAG: tol-pal system YbgF family protein [Elusimicrobiota bacterium]